MGNGDTQQTMPPGAGAAARDAAAAGQTGPGTALPQLPAPPMPLEQANLLPQFGGAETTPPDAGLSDTIAGLYRQAGQMYNQIQRPGQSFYAADQIRDQARALEGQQLMNQEMRTTMAKLQAQQADAERARREASRTPAQERYETQMGVRAQIPGGGGVTSLGQFKPTMTHDPKTGKLIVGGGTFEKTPAQIEEEARARTTGAGRGKYESSLDQPVSLAESKAYDVPPNTTRRQLLDAGRMPVDPQGRSLAQGINFVDGMADEWQSWVNKAITASNALEAAGQRGYMTLGAWLHDNPTVGDYQALRVHTLATLRAIGDKAGGRIPVDVLNAAEQGFPSPADTLDVANAKMATLRRVVDRLRQSAEAAEPGAGRLMTKRGGQQAAFTDAEIRTLEASDAFKRAPEGDPIRKGGQTVAHKRGGKVVLD